MDLFDNRKSPLTMREEQAKAIDAVMQAWLEDKRNLLVTMATGTGKALVIAELIIEVLKRWPEVNILVLTDSIEILKQDLEHLIRQSPAIGTATGVNAASIGRRDWTQQVLIAQVQSVYKKAGKLGKRHLIIVDEAHKIPRHQHSMYRKIFAAVEAGEICGVTATEFRLDSGLLTEGRNALFSEVVFRFSYAEALLAERVVPIVSKRARNEIDTSKVRIRRGEFDEAALEAAATAGDLVERACAEIVKRCEDRYTVLIFCVGIKHASDVVTTLRQIGETAAIITGKTSPQDREHLIEAFLNGDIRFMVNVGVLTTGSNIPPVDAIAVLRPTMSTGLWIQIVGRGTRLSPGKENCLLLDFGGNIRRHGPIDRARVNFDPSMLKDCPQCGAVTPASDEKCAACGYQWPKQEGAPQGPRELKHDVKPDDAPAQVTLYEPEWFSVTRIDTRRHFKYNEPDAPPSLRIDYLCGLQAYTEWLSFEREGYACEMAARWWLAMGGDAPPPVTVAEALARYDELDDITEILPVPDGKWWRIQERKLADGSIISAQYRRWTPPKPENIPFNDEVVF
jgi:DNA repair protein RadD